MTRSPRVRRRVPVIWTAMSLSTSSPAIGRLADARCPTTIRLESARYLMELARLLGLAPA
jgi:hypothetical protein